SERALVGAVAGAKFGYVVAAGVGHPDVGSVKANCSRPLSNAECPHGLTVAGAESDHAVSVRIGDPDINPIESNGTRTGACAVGANQCAVAGPELGNHARVNAGDPDVGAISGNARGPRGHAHVIAVPVLQCSALLQQAIAV